MLNTNLRKNDLKVIDIEKLLDEAEEELDNEHTKYITHEEMLEDARRIINGRI